MVYPTSFKPGWLLSRRVFSLVLSLILISGILVIPIWASSTTREVKRTARTLRISPETLLQMRQLLREITDLALRQPTPPVGQISVLASTWARFDPEEAAKQSERVFRGLRSKSEGAEPNEQLNIQAALAGILQSLAFVDPERAWKLFHELPGPEEPAEDSRSKMESSQLESAKQVRTQVQGIIAAALANCDPDRGSKIVQDVLQENRTGLTQQGGMVNMMLMSNPNLSAQLTQETLKAYKDLPLNKENINKYIGFLQSTGWGDVETIGPAARELAQKLKTAEPESLWDRPLVLKFNDTSVRLDGVEPSVFNLIRSLLHVTPTVAVKILAEFPSLEEKLNRVGGLDTALRYRGFSQSKDKDGNPEEDLTPPQKRKTTSLFSNNYMSFLPAGRGCAKDSKRFEEWRNNLKDLATNESGFDRLMAEAHNLSYRNPELAEEPLHLAEGLVEKTSSPATKAQRLIQLIATYGQINAELDSDLVDKAFAAIGKVDQKPPADQAEVKPMRLFASDPTSMLHMQLFSALARNDFQRALDRARNLADDQTKMTAMLGILQSVDGGGYMPGFAIGGPRF